MPGKSTNMLLFAIALILFATLIQIEFGSWLPIILGLVGLIIAIVAIFPGGINMLERMAPWLSEDSPQAPQTPQVPQTQRGPQSQPMQRAPHAPQGQRSPQSKPMPQAPYQPYQSDANPPVYPQPQSPRYQPQPPLYQPPEPPREQRQRPQYRGPQNY